MANQLDAALDAAGTAADYSARATFMRGYEAGQASLPPSAKEAQARIDALTAELNAVRAEAKDLDARLRDRCEDLAKVGLDNCHNFHEREAAEQMVAEMKFALNLVVGFLEHRKDSAAPAVRAAINASKPIADRWRLASDSENAMIILRELVHGAMGLDDLGLKRYDIRSLIERVRDLVEAE
jgi:hypothetical protein